MLRFAICLMIGLAGSAAGQPIDSPSDLQGLSDLKRDVLAAVNKRDFMAVGALLHQPFLVTLPTQDSFSDLANLESYYNDLFTTHDPRMKAISMSADAEGHSMIFQGTFALNRGTTKEHYELADGRIFEMPGRWTSVALKQDGTWKLLAVHAGTNFLDNPVLTAVEKTAVWWCAGGTGAGLLLGFAAGWFVRRAQGRTNG